MPFFYEDRAFQLFIACASGRTLHSCLEFEMYIAIGVLEARLAQELKLDGLVAGGLVADIDPDGTAAAPLRFFPANKLSAGGGASQLKAATAFRQALSNVVAAVDEEIKGLRRQEG